MISLRIALVVLFFWSGVSFAQQGTVNSRLQDGTGNKLTSTDNSGKRSLDVNVTSSGSGTSSSFGSAFPSTGTGSGFSDGTNMQGARVFDADTGAGVQYIIGVGLRFFGSGGSVEAGTATNPLRIDPTGTTTQPVSGTVTSNIGTTGGLALDATLSTGITSLGVMDDWDESDRAKVNPIAGQAGVQGGSGVVTALTQRAVLATDVGLPAGTNNIGDVDVVSLPTNRTVSGSFTAVNQTAFISLEGYKSFGLLFTGTFSMSIGFYISDDGVTCGDASRSLIMQNANDFTFKKSASNIGFYMSVYTGGIKYACLKVTSYLSGAANYEMVAMQAQAAPLLSTEVGNSTSGYVLTLGANNLGAVDELFSDYSVVNFYDGGLQVRPIGYRDRISFAEAGDTSHGFPSFCVRNDTITAVASEDNALAARCTQYGDLHTTLRDTAGAALVGQKAMASSLPVVIASDQSSLPVTTTGVAGETYIANVIASAAGASKDHLNIFNATGSGKIIKIRSIKIAPAFAATVTGLAQSFTISRSSTVGTTCTGQTIVLVDTNNTAVPAQVTASTNCTGGDPTIAASFFSCAISGDETHHMDASGLCYNYLDNGGQPITLREDQGLTIVSTALSGAYPVTVAIEFTM